MPAVAPSPFETRLKQLGGCTPDVTLTVIGDAMRRRPGHPESARPEETERALGALSVQATTSAVAAAVVEEAAASVARAAEDAFECAFAEGPEDRALYASSAMDGLAARDAVASLQCAAARRLDLARRGGPPGNAEVDALASALDLLAARVVAADRNAASWARSLTAVNAERRVAFAGLSEAAQAHAWWYGARLADDGLLQALAGAGAGTLSADGRAEVDGCVLPMSGALTTHDLDALSTGTTDPAARARLERIGARDPDVLRGLELALDRSIEEDAVRD